MTYKELDQIIAVTKPDKLIELARACDCIRGTFQNFSHDSKLNTIAQAIKVELEVTYNQHV